MSIELPYIKNQTTDNSAMTYIPPDSIKIAMPIEGTSGRMSTMKISSQAQLLNEYSVTSEISPKLSDSMLHALKLLQFTPIYTSRVGSTNVLPGRSDKPGVDGNYTVFTDSEYSPYYKSHKFAFGSRTELNSVVVKGDSTTAESKDMVDSLYKFGARSITDNGILLDFLSTKKINSLEVNGVDIVDKPDFTETDLSNKSIVLGYSRDNIGSVKGPEDGFCIQLNGNSFYNGADQNIYDITGVPTPLSFYKGHGSKANQAISGRKTKDLPIEAISIYIMDYLKSNGLVTPVMSDYGDFYIDASSISSNVKIEVLGDDISKIVTVDEGIVKVAPNSYTPNNCGFKITITNLEGDNVYFIGLGKFSDEAKSSNYYKLNPSEFSTVEKLVYRLYEVLSYSTVNSWLGLDLTSVLMSEFNPKFYFLDTTLLQRSIEPNDEDDTDGSESGVDFYKFDKANKLYSYTLGDTKYQIENLKYANQYLTITKTVGTDVKTTTDYVFYNGTYPYDPSPSTEYIRLSAAQLTYNEFLSLLISALKTKFNATYSTNGFSLYEKDISVEYKLFLDPDNSGIFNLDLSEESSVYDESSGLIHEVIDFTSVINNASLIVVSTGLNSENILKFQITIDSSDPELYHLLLTRKNNEESYVISFVEDKVDGYGVTRYYTYVNDEDTGSKYFRLVRINNVISNLPKDSVQSPLFGAEVPQWKSSTTDWQVAVNRFREDTGDQYDFIFDGGHANVSLGNTIANVGQDLYAGVGLTLPDVKSVDDLVLYRNSLGVDNRQVVMRAPRVPDTTLGNFVVYMSPITQYLNRLVMNKSASKEFAPIFGITNGSSTLAPKYKYDSEEERQKLVNAQIAPLIWDRAEQLSYFLLDLTGQTLDSNMSDFNNVRMDNLIAHISDRIAIKYIGRFNDKETREEFVSELDIAIQQRLISHQIYRINAYKIICDETNNPDSVVDARQLVVDIYEQYRPGIRYVKIYQGIYKLSQAI